ncbi:MAG: hypothetical protein PHQ26_02610 [Bacteroidales bacterium]|nr:hypothetical protein [Bacteroidales bacterium]MDD4770361.1 hypothetical protein [Bacteroidales bacterium]
MKKIFSTKMVALIWLLCSLPTLLQAASDPLQSFKLNLTDTSVCQVYYYRANKYEQASEFVIVGGAHDGSDSIVTKINNQLPFVNDGDLSTFGKFSAQSFVIYDFGEKGVSLKKIRVSNSGFYWTKRNENHQMTTVFGALYGATDTADFKVNAAQIGLDFQNKKFDFFRTNGTAQKPDLHSFKVTENKWVTGTVDSSYNAPGYYTLQAEEHEKYRYVAVFDWSNTYFPAEVEMWGVKLADNTLNDAQINLAYSVGEAEVYAADFALSDASAVAVLQTAITDAKTVLNGSDTTAVTVDAAVNTLKAATESFMSSITYVLGEDEFYCKLITPDGSYGLALASEQTTVGGYTGYALKVTDPSMASNFSIAKAGILNGQQSYKLSNVNGTVIQTGSTLMLVDNAQVTTSNTAQIVFTQRYYSEDAGMGLYDMKAGSHFYYIDGENLSTVTTFPSYESFEEINAYLFTLEAGNYDGSNDDTSINWTGWQFNDPATTNFEKFGNHSGNIVDGWRLNKWRMYTRVAQETVGDKGYMVLSINDTYYERADTMTLTPLQPDFTSDVNYGIGICRESGQYANLASPDPINQIRDSVYIEYVNPYYTPYIGIKMAVTNPDSMDLSLFSLGYFIKKGAVEPALTLANVAGRKGDVYYWKLTDCGFTVGQIGYAAQYISAGNMYSCKGALVLDWIKPFASLAAIPEDSIASADLAAIMASLPETPQPEPEPYVDPRELIQMELETSLSIYDASQSDISNAKQAELAKLVDTNKDVAVDLSGSEFLVLKLEGDAAAFNELKVHYSSTAALDQTHVYFVGQETLDLSNLTVGNVVWNTAVIAGKTGFSGKVANDANNRLVTFTNTQKDSVKYIVLQAKDAASSLPVSELLLNYYKTPLPINLKDSMMAVVRVYNQSVADVTANFSQKVVMATDGDVSQALNLNTKNFLVYDFGERGAQIDSIKVYNNGVVMQTNEFASVMGDCSTANFTEPWNSATKKDILRTNGSVQNGVAVGFNNWSNGSYSVVNPGTWRYVAFYNWSNNLNISEVEIFGEKRFAKLQLPSAAKVPSVDSITAMTFGKTGGDRNTGDNGKILAWQDSNFIKTETMGGGSNLLYDFGPAGAYISKIKLHALSANEHIQVASVGDCSNGPVEETWFDIAGIVPGKEGDYIYNGITENETLVLKQKLGKGTWVADVSGTFFTIESGEVGKVRYIRLSEWSNWGLTEIEIEGYLLSSGEIVSNPIVRIDSDAAVVQRSYYNLNGLRLNGVPEQGMYLEKSILEDGRIRVKKYMIP